MAFRNRRIWKVVNALLFGSILVLLVLLLANPRWLRGRAKQQDSAVGRLPPSEPAAVDSTMSRRVNAGQMGMRPISFVHETGSRDRRGVWMMRGMQPQEWAPLPACPGMDMQETTNGYLLAFSMPGVRPEDVQLSMTGRVVLVHAILRDGAGNRMGGMDRRVLLPRTPGNPADFQARFTNGILRVCVAK